MGKWTPVAYEGEMVRKSKFLFNLVQDKMKKDNPESTFSFENFVDALDENDKFIRRLFEFLIKETLQRHRKSRSQSQPYPESESSTQRFRSRLGSFPFQLTPNEFGNIELTDTPDGLSEERTTSPGTGSSSSSGDRPIPSITPSITRRNTRLGNLSEFLELQRHQSQTPSMLDRRLSITRVNNGGSANGRPIAHLYRSSSSMARRESNVAGFPEYATSRLRLSPRLSADATADHDSTLASDIQDRVIHQHAMLQQRAMQQRAIDMQQQHQAIQQQAMTPAAFVASPRLRPEYR